MSETVVYDVPFKDIALPLVRRGMYVIPLAADGSKKPLIADWPNMASCDVRQIEKWNERWPRANCGVVMRHVCVCDDDLGDFAERVKADTGHEMPATLTVRTSKKPTGLFGRHYYFVQTADGHGSRLPQ